MNAKCQSCKEPAEDGRERPVITTQVVFKGGFKRATCDSCGDIL